MHAPRAQRTPQGGLSCVSRSRRFHAPPDALSFSLNTAMNLHNLCSEVLEVPLGAAGQGRPAGRAAAGADA